MIVSTAAARLREQSAQRVLLTDGAFGTMIQAYKLTEADYRGDLVLTDDQKGNNDLLVLTRPVRSARRVRSARSISSKSP